MPIDRRRDEFPTLADGVYLLSHSLGPAPRSAEDAMRRYYEHWRGNTREDAWQAHWWALSNEVGDLFGRILGAAPGSTLPVPNASLAMSIVASCMNWRGRPKVVTTALDFPSMGYVWSVQERLGAEIHVVESDDGVSIPTERLLEAIDERTRIVAVAHTSYRSSHRLDGAAVAARAREVGAYSLLDVYQSAGVVRLDAAGWGADFMIGGSIKWLLGGPACGYLYVRPELIPTLEPGLTGWFAHENPFAFAHEPIRYDDSIRRFAQGTAVIPSLYSVRPGLEMVLDVGLDVIESESRRRTERIVAEAQRRGWPLHSPADVDRRGGTVMLGFDDPGGFASALRERRVFVDWRPGVGIRLSPHFFNTDDEVERALEEIRAVEAGAARS